MMKSMTGFGSHEMFIDNRRFSVEIKSVNHKYCEITIKLPRFLNEFEHKFRQILKDNISRGKVDVYINFETFSENDYKITFNEQLGDIYYKQLTAIKDRYSLQKEISIDDILKLPDILKSEKSLDDESLLNVLYENFEKTLNLALDNFISMRSNEGKKLENDIIEKLGGFKEILEKIEDIYPSIINEYKENITKKVEELLNSTDIDETRILTEVMLYSDKACIDEEITRLYSHLSQFSDIIIDNAAIGRKLDFLIQEINREINTIASKSNDITITKYVVELKTLLEKIREQVQNIE
ncbi:MAG: YicC/YloC family endoribonuclease [Lachnospirales bacterium]